MSGNDGNDKLAGYRAYRKVVADTAAMVSDTHAQALARRHGLQVLNVTWEDTGRFKNSSVGPNISDMTIQVQQMDPRSERFRLTCMPVIRFPNFRDKTADLPLGSFSVLVGNEKGKALRAVPIGQLLGNLRDYLSVPSSWKGPRRSLLAPRDTHVLVSAQACFLPVPQGGAAAFNPVLFNYQSRKGDPAVLTILATREGTSVTVIDNQRDAFQAGRTWGQRLFFNHAGKRASLTGKRLSDHLAAGGEVGGTKPESNRPRRPGAGAAAGLSMVLLVQVPLKQKRPSRMSLDVVKEDVDPGVSASPRGRTSDVETAVIGHGKLEGPFTEIDGLDIERDPRFPIRVTVQFYKATSNGVVSEADITAIAAQIRRVYDDARFVGSLVTEGVTGRPTEHDGPRVEPPDWWPKFWERHRRNTGQSEAETLAMLNKLFGPNWHRRSEPELAKAIGGK
ncbi:MAG: hypothetical protein H6837_06645 [Planctomycetes bacterium]|nr:hypothetical protein [Planctomycetota bacterium]